MPTFTYDFGTGDNLTVVTNGLTTDNPSFGAGYDITSITGTFFGYNVIGMYGSGGYEGFNANTTGVVTDNIIFNGHSNGDGGSAEGLDTNGITFEIDLGGGTIGYVNVSYNYGSNPPTWSAQTVINGVDSNVALNGTYNSVIVSNNTPCYCRGSLILTSRGEVAVEDLVVGDSAVTASGAARPIKWIGKRSYAGRLAANNPKVMPICFKRGALADNVPRRDLWVSPEHAMYLDGALVPAKLLVNGVSIVKAASVEEVHYYHVELETHDVILAEGAAAESFVDDGGRGVFHNVLEFHALYPDETIPTAARYCAPRVEDGEALEQHRRTLLGRARRLRADGTAAPEAALQGSIDAVSYDRIAGWVFDQASPEAPVRAVLLSNGAVIAEFSADQPRPDVAEAGFGTGRYGFDIALTRPLSKGVRHEIVLRSASDWTPLPGPASVLEASEALVLRAG
jgi:hypothetical protein